MTATGATLEARLLGPLRLAFRDAGTRLGFDADPDRDVAVDPDPNRSVGATQDRAAPSPRTVPLLQSPHAGTTVPGPPAEALERARGGRTESPALTAASHAALARLGDDLREAPTATTHPGTTSASVPGEAWSDAPLARTLQPPDTSASSHAEPTVAASPTPAREAGPQSAPPPAPPGDDAAPLPIRTGFDPAPAPRRAEPSDGASGHRRPAPIVSGLRSGPSVAWRSAAPASSPLHTQPNARAPSSIAAAPAHAADDVTPRHDPMAAPVSLPRHDATRIAMAASPERATAPVAEPHAGLLPVRLSVQPEPAPLASLAPAPPFAPPPRLRRIADAMEPVFDRALELDEAADPPGAAPGGTAPSVRNTFNVQIALADAPGLADREALQDALVDLLRDAARRHGLDV